MNFKGKQVVQRFTLINHGSPQEVFPLLCPEREKEWLEGWDSRMIHSNSGYAEKDCVFITTQDEKDTVWQITQYQPPELLEFIRVTPQENVVRINIRLEKRDDGHTNAYVTYRYTALSEDQNQFMEEALEPQFEANMKWWEQALNHFLECGEKLRRS